MRKAIRPPQPSRSRVCAGLLAAAVLLLAPTDSMSVLAQTAGDAAPARRDGIRAAQLTGAIRVDGRVDEEAWTEAPVVTGFVQRDPIEGAPAEQPTTVRVLYDDEAIYIAASLTEPDPSRIARQLVRRDEGGQFDAFEVFFDTNLDGRTGYSFRVSAAGVQSDSYLFDDVREDESWDAVWESDVAILDDGWSVELRIPLSQLLYQRTAGPQTWGVNFARRRVARNETTYFALVSRRRHGKVSVFRRLHGLELPTPSGHLEVQPYALARGRTADSDADDPFFDGAEAGLGAGLDLRYRLGAAYTIDATVNPDFGQVEVDPAVINLTAFETFFPEKRPFFVEDARIFDYDLSGGNNTLFYSRRIGRQPHRPSLDDADFSDTPAQTSILGAAKLTGRTARGLSIGVLAAATERVEGRSHFVATDSTAAFVAEPRSFYAVARARQDLAGGRSFVGGLLTGVRRALPAGGAFDALPSEAFSAGLDFEHTWDDRGWALWGFLAGSHVRGDRVAMIDIQRSANHYFQRPDATRLEVDSTATALSGAEWRLQLDRRSGRHWTGAVWLAQRTPGFHVNDLGFFNGSERLDGGARIVYQQIEPGDLLRSYRVNLVTYHNWRHEALDNAFSWGSWGRAHKAGAVRGSVWAEFLNYWGIDIDARYEPEVLDDALTRGGPLMLDPARVGFGLRAWTDRRDAINLEPSIGWDDGGAAGSGWRASIELDIRPDPRWQLEFEPEYRWSNRNAQFVAATDDVGYQPTYGARYLFGQLEQRSFSLESRLNYAFTPRLTLQLYMQPLLSTGDYTGFAQLARAGTFELAAFDEGTAIVEAGGVRCAGGTICLHDGDRYLDADADGTPEHVFADPEYRVRSLRGNAVLRWEYRPGSTLYVVWQQERLGDGRPDDGLRILDDTAALLDSPAENVLIVKAQYWLGL